MSLEPLPFEHRALAIDALVHTLEDAPDPGLRTVARDLVQALLSLHADGLKRILELVDSAGDPGATLLDRFTADSAICHLLLLHNLHPVDLETRVRQALDRAVPLLTALGGGVALVGVEADGTVRLRLDGEPQAGPGARAALTSALADAIYDAAPDVMALHIEGVSLVGPGA